jgi:toxin ParE1/3/4
MSRIVKQASARRGLAESADYLRRHASADTARRFLAAAERAFESLAAMPKKGGLWESDRPELNGVRVWPIPRFKNHLIFYRPSRDGINVLRVIHAARDLEDLL